MSCLYEHFSYLYGPEVTVQCLWCHCIHAAYQYDAPAPLLCIPWRNTHTTGLTQNQICRNAPAQIHTQKHKHFKKRQTIWILIKLYAKNKTVTWVFQGCMYGNHHYYCLLIINWMIKLNSQPWHVSQKVVLKNRNTGRKTQTAVLTQLPAVLSLCRAPLFSSLALPPLL